MKTTRLLVPALVTVMVGLAACSSGASGSDKSQDRGIYACQQYAGPQQGSDSPDLVKALQASKYDQPKQAGDAEEKAFASGDTSQEISAGFTLAAACAKHGIDITTDGS